jgi:hypothetical protein
MHIINKNVKLINANTTRFQLLKFLTKISQIVENMDYLYV